MLKKIMAAAAATIMAVSATSAVVAFADNTGIVTQADATTVEGKVSIPIAAEGTEASWNATTIAGEGAADVFDTDIDWSKVEKIDFEVALKDCKAALVQYYSLEAGKAISVTETQTDSCSIDGSDIDVANLWISVGGSMGGWSGAPDSVDVNITVTMKSESTSDKNEDDKNTLTVPKGTKDKETVLEIKSLKDFGVTSVADTRHYSGVTLTPNDKVGAYTVEYTVLNALKKPETKKVEVAAGEAIKITDMDTNNFGIKITVAKSTGKDDMKFTYAVDKSNIIDQTTNLTDKGLLPQKDKDGKNEAVSTIKGGDVEIKIPLDALKNTGAITKIAYTDVLTDADKNVANDIAKFYKLTYGSEPTVVAKLTVEGHLNSANGNVDLVFEDKTAATVTVNKYDGESTVVVSVNKKDGKVTGFDASALKPASGKVTFTTTHFSEFYFVKADASLVEKLTGSAAPADPDTTKPADPSTSDTSNSGTSSEPANSGTSSEPANSGTNSGTNSGSNSGNDENNPSTGIALAVAPVAIAAAAAVIISKKRK